MSETAQPLAGTTVVELARSLPGAYAGRALLRLGARVVRVEGPDGDPMRSGAPAWDRVLRAGKESVVCDLHADPSFAVALCSAADVVLEGFRPGVVETLGIGPGALPESVVYCSITGFGAAGPHARRAGHDLNYLGWSGVLADTGSVVPPVQVADLAAGGLGAVTQVLAALLRRTRTGAGGHVVVSMTHGSHDLVAHRLGGDPVPRLLTGGVACYRVYTTADGRGLTVAALEPRFFQRLCELVGRPQLAARQYDPDQEQVASELTSVIATRTLADWLALFDGEDVCAGPVATLAEAHADLGPWPEELDDAPLGAHTAAWRHELGL
jgi:crotonobetainyl-CoA:carnitine CoA-transferase CaiB-like acyl-CoA transferase